MPARHQCIDIEVVLRLGALLHHVCLHAGKVNQTGDLQTILRCDHWAIDATRLGGCKKRNEDRPVAFHPHGESIGLALDNLGEG